MKYNGIEPETHRLDYIERNLMRIELWSKEYGAKFKIKLKDHGQLLFEDVYSNRELAVSKYNDLIKTYSIGDSF